MVTFHRRLPRMGYFKPGNLRETLKLLDEEREARYLVYAGGTDVIPKLRGRLIKPPSVLLDLKGIKELDFISYDAKTGLRIGALATVFSVVEAEPLEKNYPALFQGAKRIASTHIQNRGTIAGNICNALPSADSAPALLCLDAKVVCVSKGGKRTLHLNRFFIGPNKTSLAPGEIVGEIEVPPVTTGTCGSYIKLSPRNRMDLAIASSPPSLIIAIHHATGIWFKEQPVRSEKIVMALEQKKPKS